MSGKPNDMWRLRPPLADAEAGPFGTVGRGSSCPHRSRIHPIRGSTCGNMDTLNDVDWTDRHRVARGAASNAVVAFMHFPQVQRRLPRR